MEPLTHLLELSLHIRDSQQRLFERDFTDVISLLLAATTTQNVVGAKHGKRENQP